jgi:Pentapeptide repeats (8 copies)
MIDHKKIEEAIDSYFKNTPTAKIIENLDRLSADREKDLDREKINHKATNNKNSIIGNLVRFEEVSPANQDAAFLTVSIESLVAPLGLPLYEGYDDLDEMRLTFLTLPSGETVTLMEYLHSPQPGVCICVDANIQNIPQIVFDSCLQLKVSREEVSWFHPDRQEEIDRLYTEHGAIEKQPESSQSEKLPQHNQYEPIDCFNHALRIYTREYVPATYWAMLQHNLGLAYVNRIKGDRIENLERSIEHFNRSLEIFTQDAFPEKWKISQNDLGESLRFLKSFKLLQKHSLTKDILNQPIFYRNLRSAELSHTNLIYANLRYADLSRANLTHANLMCADLIYANLMYANLSGTNLTHANLSSASLRNTILVGANLNSADLRDTNLREANLSDADVENTKFGYNSGISESMKQDLIARGAIFDIPLEEDYHLKF